MKTLSVINPNAAGIDVGSEKLFLSLAGDEPVVFGTVTDEVYRQSRLSAQGFPGCYSVTFPASETCSAPIDGRFTPAKVLHDELGAREFD